METTHECKRNATLFNFASAAMLAAAGACSSAAWAQSTSLQPPTSGLKAPIRTGIVAAPPQTTNMAAPMAQIAPANANLNANVQSGAVGKSYTLQAQIVPGAALTAAQRLATAKAALDEIARQAKEQQDKETEAKIALLQQTLTVGNSATLSILSPKSPIGNATLSLGMAYSVDFENNHVTFNSLTLKSFGPLMGWPAAYCAFKAPDDGFYMVAFTLENFPNTAGVLDVSASLNKGAFTPGEEAKARLNKGTSVVAVIKEYRKGDSALSRITGEGVFAFRSCEISRIK